MRIRRTVVAFSVLGVAACGDAGGLPITPSPPSATYGVLRGVVTYQGQPVASAFVEILDGADRAALVLTRTDGAYRFTQLTRGQFSAQARATGYVSDMRRIALAADETVQDFTLTRADLIFFDALVVDWNSSAHTFAFTGSMRNRGDACATRIRGEMELRFGGESVARLPWALPPEQIVEPGAVTTYTTCCIADRYAGQDGEYFTTAVFDSVSCER